MEVQVNKKDIIEAMKNVQLQGKWATTTGLSSKSLGEYAYFETRDNELLLVNSDDSTTAVKSIPAEIEGEGSFILEIDTIKKYLTKMDDEITFVVGDTVVMQSSGKKATMPIVIRHPYGGRITRFLNYWPFSFEEELITVFKMGEINLRCGIQIKGDVFHNAIDACEVVNHGIYKMNFIEEDELSNAKFIISSDRQISSYQEEIEYNATVGESSTVLFSSPLHKFFNKGDIINVFIGDDQPVVMITENSAIIRAPRVGD
jgi:hypothetical protein